MNFAMVKVTPIAKASRDDGSFVKKFLWADEMLVCGDNKNMCLYSIRLLAPNCFYFLPSAKSHCRLEKWAITPTFGFWINLPHVLS